MTSLVEMGDASVSDLVEQCQASAAQCTPLCERILPRGPAFSAIKQCGLTTVDGGLAVHVVYAEKCVAS